MTNILVLHYSQTGQLTRVARSMMAPLENLPDVKITWQELKPKKTYPYPWSILDFLDAFPESVYMVPPEMEPVSFNAESRFDLVILAHQAWFLAPSLPVTGFLKSDAARALKGTPVITLIACRNMWISAQEKVKAELQSLGAALIDNVVLVDQGPPLLTFVTTPYWLLTGNKGPYRFSPAAGVGEGDIAAAARFGRALRDSLHLLKSSPGASLLWGMGAVKVNPRYIMSEKMAQRSFLIWGRLLRAVGGPGHPVRRAVLVVYAVFLITMILTLVPAGIIVYEILKPFIGKQLNARVAEIEKPSGSSTERLAKYAA